MVDVGKQFQNVVARVVTSPVVRRSLHTVRETRRRLLNEPRVLTVFFGMDDPHSYLLAQVLDRLRQTYGVEVNIVPVGPPGTDYMPNRSLAKAYLLSDAKAIAPWYGLSFPGRARPADPNLTARALGVMLAEREPQKTLDLLTGLCDAVWGHDEQSLNSYAERFGKISSGEVAQILRDGRKELEEVGHYDQGVIHYQGEWFRGFDRLELLESRLRRNNDTEKTPVLRRRILRLPEVVGPKPNIEMFFSFRSPYSYLALDRAYALADQHEVSLTVKPVLPMVDRGMVVPLSKRLNILSDAGREAEVLGIPFGNVIDPLGQGVERALAMWHLAKQLDWERPFLLIATRAIWSQGIDISTDAGSRVVAERAGLPWERVEPLLEAQTWRTMVEQNAKELSQLGLWGVPTFRVGENVTWGQDRVWLLDAWLNQYVRHAD